MVLNDLTATGHHLVCTGCGAARDVFLGDVAVEVPAGQAAGFRLGRPEITFRGRCPDCRDRRGSTTDPQKGA